MAIVLCKLDLERSNDVFPRFLSLIFSHCSCCGKIVLLLDNDYGNSLIRACLSSGFDIGTLIIVFLTMQL